MTVPEYVWLPPASALPGVRGEPFRAVLISEEPASAEWRDLVSAWLVESGCLYVMAWGLDCGAWEHAVDTAVLEAFDYGQIPDDSFMMTTSHEDEALEEAFWFCEHCALGSTTPFARTVLVHISSEEREHQLIAAYQTAAQAEVE